MRADDVNTKCGTSSKAARCARRVVNVTFESTHSSGSAAARWALLWAARCITESHPLSAARRATVSECGATTLVT